MVYRNYIKHQNHSSLTFIEDHNVPGETLPTLDSGFRPYVDECITTYDQVAD
jgi:hypothetical protein